MSETSHKGFPRSLLEQPIDDRLSYFDKLVVTHQHLTKARESLIHAIRYSAGASSVLVFGPTGVGKTTLRQQIERQLIQDATSDPNANPGHIPVVGIEAVAPDSGSFNWRDYYVRALQALDEPMLKDKITYQFRGFHRDDQGLLVIEKTTTAPELRRVLEKCVIHRQLRAFIVDEAQHFQKMASGSRLLDQADSLKSLAAFTKTVHVLIGTYDLQEMTKLGAQLSRRTIKIHFPRYRADNPDDMKEFNKLLRTFQKYLPLAEEPDLVSHTDYFYDHCLGCIGMLKTWLYRTLAAALEQKLPTITEDIWKVHAEAPGTLIDMSIEIRRGEEHFWKQKDERLLDDLRTQLRDVRAPNEQPNLPTQSVLQEQRSASLPTNGVVPQDQSSPSLLPTEAVPKPRKRRVGQPNAKRRTVGGRGKSDGS